MLKLFIADLKLLVRNKQLLFWNFAFPLIFTVIFGFFFSGNGGSAGKVGVIDSAHTQLSEGLRSMLNDQTAFRVADETARDDISAKIKKGEESGGIIIPAGFGEGSITTIDVLYDPGSAAARAAIDGVVNAYLTQASFQAQGARPLFAVRDTPSSAASFTYFDFVLVGLLGMSLMNSAIQGLAISMARYREDQILKRITTTPLSPWKFIISEVLSRLLINLVQVAVILAVGIYAFHSHVGLAEVPALLGLSVVGAIVFQLMGFAIAALSKNTDAAEGMAQAIATPMMFLSGVFFASDSLPHWLQTVVQFLPLSPLLHIMRSVSLEGGRLMESPLNVGILAAWIVVLLVFVRFRFKLTEE